MQCFVPSIILDPVPDHPVPDKAAQKLRETGMEGAYHLMTQNRRLK